MDFLRFYSLFSQTLRKEKTGERAVHWVLTSGEERGHLASKSAHICVCPWLIQTHSRCRQHRRHTTCSHITEQSRPTSQVGIREERDNPDHQPVSLEERQQDRVEAECIENRREDKVGKSLASLAAGVAGWRVALPGSRERV